MLSIFKTFSKRFFLYFLLFLLFLPFFLSAFSIVIKRPSAYPIWQKLVSTFTNFLFWVGVIVGTFLLIGAAFFLLMSGGNPERVEKAKELILVATIGIFIVSSIKVVINISGKLFGVAPSTGTMTTAGLTCTPGDCDLSLQLYCNGGVWIFEDVSNPSSLYCQNCNHCSDGVKDCGETHVDCGSAVGCPACFVALGFGFIDTTPPNITNTHITPISAPQGTLFEIRVKITDANPIASAYALLQRPDNTVLEIIELFDDGLHSDVSSSDSIFGNVWNSASFPEGPYYVDIKACDNWGNCSKLDNI